MRIINSYVARVQAAAAVDPVVGRAFLRVANTVDRPDKLLRPSVGLRVLRAGRTRGPGERAPRQDVAPVVPPAAATGGRRRRRRPSSAADCSVPPVGFEPTLGPF